ncbi:MAG: winged helix-turn-helix transcriptional regulator [Candidatus Altiarchaeota archaeon]|nr:winged helix-turn-helix transcriptional regulator [Candidatus Altiarchaeota archaeon]
MKVIECKLYEGNMKFIIRYFLIALFFVHVSFAQVSESGVYSNEFGISSVDYISLDIKENGFVDVEKTLTLSDETAGVFISCPVDGLRLVGVNDEELVYTTENMGGGVFVKFLGGAGNQVRLYYSTDHLVGKNGSKWTVRYSTSASQQNTLIYVYFPPATRILPLSGDLLFSPVENGLLLYPDSDVFSFRIGYGLQQTDSTTLITLDEFYIVLGFLFLIVLALFFWMRSRGQSVDSEDALLADSGLVTGFRVMDSIKNTLDENEGRIVEMLESSDDEITQAYIYKSTGIPKSTLSEIINRLERRNILKRRKEGRTNWLKLQKWIFG